MAGIAQGKGKQQVLWKLRTSDKQTDQFCPVERETSSFLVLKQQRKHVLTHAFIHSSNTQSSLCSRSLNLIHFQNYYFCRGPGLLDSLICCNKGSVITFFWPCILRSMKSDSDNINEYYFYEKMDAVWGLGLCLQQPSPSMHNLKPSPHFQVVNKPWTRNTESQNSLRKPCFDPWISKTNSLLLGVLGTQHRKKIQFLNV